MIKIIDNIINDIYNTSPDYHNQHIHIAVYPLKNASVIMAFVDSKTTRYKQLYKQLRKMNNDDQLAAINFIIHRYTENVFLSKEIDAETLNNPAFKIICQQGDILKMTVCDYLNMANGTRMVEAVVPSFSLSNRGKIPNLLSEKYALHNSTHN